MPLAVQLVVPLAVPLPPRLFVHDTCVTPTLSAAVPLTVSVLDPVVLPVAGEVTDTVGGVVSTVGGGVALLVLANVTNTGADVVVLPAASRATAVSVCLPSGVESVYQEIR